MAASPREPDEDGLRITVGLKRLVLRRTDGAEEDDFKTWALAQLVTCDGRPWDELWYGRAAAEDGSDANLAKTSVTNGFEAAYNYKRRSKPVDIKHIAERLPGARMEVTVFKGAARDPSADTPIGHASLLLAPLASGRPIERRLQLLPPPAPAAASASGAATPSPGGSPSKGAKAAAAPAPAAEAAASAAPAAEYEGAVRVRVEADARLGAALAGGRFLRLTSASLSGVPFRWTPPGGDVGDERPVIADAAEEAALDEAGHQARAAACGAAGEAGGARYALVMSLEGLRGEAPSKGRAAGSGSGLGSVYAPAAEAEAARTAAQAAARRLAGWAEGPGGDVIRGDDVPEDAAEAAKAAAEAAAAEAAERAQAGGGWALALGGGAVVYRRTGGSDPAAAAASADADVDADADADAAGAAAGSGAATPRSGAGAPDSEPAAPAGAWAWGVEWKDLGSGPTGGRIFLSADDVAALRARTAAGGRAVVGLRRVMAEPVEDPAVAAALPADAEFGLPRGWLPAQEDVDGRGLAELDLSALLQESVTECEVGAALQGRVPTEAEAEAAEEAAAARADRWAEAEEAAEAAIAAASGGAAAAGGKKKGGSAKDKKKASSAKDKKKASSAKDKKKAGSAKDKKKGGAAGKKGAAEEEEAEEPPPKPVLDQAASSIAIRLELDRALVEPPPPAPTPVRRAADLVPTRPPPPRGDVGLGATAEFRRDVVLAAHAIAEQYAAVAHSAGAGRGSGSSPDDRRRALLAELNESGVYLALKERLRKAAVRIVRERFRDAPRAGSAGDVGSGDVSGKVSGTGSLLPPQREAFVSQLFVFLSGQVSRALNAAFDAADAAAAAAAAAAPAGASGAAGGARGGAGRGLPGPPSLSGAAGSPSDAVSDATAALASQLATFGEGVSALLDEPDPSNALAAMTGSAVPAAVEPEDARLGRLAAEAEFRGDVATAERFHQDRVARMEEAALQDGGAFTTDVWCAYAEWLCRRGQLSKAEAAAREAVAIDPGCVRALCLLAAVAAERGQALAAGETFARDAVSASRRQQEEAWAALASACSGGAVPGYGAGVPGAMAGSAEPASAEEAGASLGGPGMPGADEDEDEDEDDGGDEAGSAGRMQDGGGDAALLTSSEALSLVAEWAAAAELESRCRAVAARLAELTGQSRAARALLRRATALEVAAASLRARAAEEERVAGSAGGWGEGAAEAGSGADADGAAAEAGVAAATEAELDTGVWTAGQRLGRWGSSVGLCRLAGSALSAAREAAAERPLSVAVSAEQSCLEAVSSLRAACTGVAAGLEGALAAALAAGGTDLAVSGDSLGTAAAGCASAEQAVGAGAAAAAADAGARPADIARAAACAADAVAAVPGHRAAWEAEGMACLLQGQWPEAKTAFERAVGGWDPDHVATASPAALLLLAELYLAEHAAGHSASSAGQPLAEPRVEPTSAAPASAPLSAGADSLAGAAHEAALAAAERTGWAVAWEAAGRAAAACGDSTAAEAALAEANVRDTSGPTAWGWLCSVCLSAEPPRAEEAAASLERALANGLSGGRHNSLLRRLGAQFRSLGKLGAAEAVLRRATVGLVGAGVAVEGVAAATRVRLGEVLLEAGKAAMAAAAFTEALKSAGRAQVAEEAKEGAAAAERALGRRAPAAGGGAAKGASLRSGVAASMGGHSGEFDQGESRFE